MKVAALITCYNRKTKTLACLGALFESVLPVGCLLEVFLVDDGSSDGTAAAVCGNYPQVNIINGEGNLYWNRGMHLAFSTAIKNDYDYYLWINDDTLLYPTSIESLVSTARDPKVNHGKGVIVVGSTQDAMEGRLTYGGVVRMHRFKRTTFTPITPCDVPVECETMNGNCVLVPKEVALEVGNLESKFVHAMGDLDYGLRARKAGFSIWVMNGYAGTCSCNSSIGSFKDASLPLAARLRMMMQPKGLPIKSWCVFTRRHAGYLWPVFWLSPYVKVFLKGLLKK